MSHIWSHDPQISGGGQNGTSNRFIDVFWYLEALGKQASLGVHAFARSTLTGGFYEQLDHTKGFRPNPDYWAGDIKTKVD